VLRWAAGLCLAGLCVAAIGVLLSSAVRTHPSDPALSSTVNGPRLTNLSASAATVPLYEKFELTFGVANTVATDLQFPYDPAPPAGLPAATGISVEGLFLPPGESDWSQALHQPGFLYQDYQRQQIDGAEWLYPQGSPVWKVRFAPTALGTWQYQVRAQDASICPAGANPCSAWVTSSVGSFAVQPPLAGNHGFLHVSPTDSRYFQFSDGTPFVGLGFNDGFSTTDFSYDADAKLAQDAANGITFLRTWLSSSDIAGSSWGPWSRFGAPTYGGYLPDPGLEPAPPGSGHDFAFALDQATGQSCIFDGFTQGPIAVKPATTYRFAVTVDAHGITGPRNAADPRYGFTVKQANWPNADTCPDGLAAAPNLLPYLQTTTGWETLQGTLTTGPSQRFLDRYLYLLLDNVSGGRAYVSDVSLREVMPDGSLGPEVLVKSQSDAYLDFNQARSWDWDQVLDQAAKDGVYLKLVVLEKNDRIWNDLNRDGIPTPSGGNDNFYAAPNTKVRRLQEYYWRYLAARWGYSTAVHSWELLNEGDPLSKLHYEQANTFAREMHQLDPNRHLVTTSTWNSFPASQFWGNPAYRDVDYADLHAYISTGGGVYGESAFGNHVRLDRDLAWFTTVFSLHDGARGDSAVGKPVVRGESGIDSVDGSGELRALADDRHGVWLHNLEWGTLNPGGMYELYWWTDNIVKNNLFFQYKPLHDFLEGIPLDNGHYQDVNARVSASNVRVLGQKDVVDGKAHFWIQNVGHTWYDVVNQIPWGSLSGTVMVAGFAPDRTYSIAWWEFDDPGSLTIQEGTVTADASGNLTLDLATLPSTVTDVAVKISGDTATGA